MANKKSNNAIVNCSKEGKYFNLYLTIPQDNGEDIKLLVKPITKDNKTLSKLLYKIYVTLGEK